MAAESVAKQSLAWSETQPLPEHPLVWQRWASSPHTSGRYSRQAMGKLALQVLTDKLTAAWQFACLPIWPQYCRATPTEYLPCLGNAVSSTIHATTGPCFCMAGSTCCRTWASISSSLQGASATK